MDNKAPILERFFSLKDKAALITGSSSGLGRALAIGIAEAGAAVGVHGRDEERIHETCAMVEDVGGKAIPLVADLRGLDDCRDLIDRARQALGRLDILVNNAATNRRKPIAEVTEDDWEFLNAVNLQAPYFLSQAAYPMMRGQGGGKIIHIGSINIYYGLDTVSVYGLTKGGLAQMTKTMAVEWALDNIQVNCITPGFILTPLSRALWADEKKSLWFRNRIPLRRPGLPEELVGLALMLASEASSYLTGQNITIDGGFSAGGSWHNDESWSDETLPPPLRKENWFK
jgi:NAD(P)-dependent dehydrogenase (short-subunit alcohol dehydrogenase family)